MLTYLRITRHLTSKLRIRTYCSSVGTLNIPKAKTDCERSEFLQLWRTRLLHMNQTGQEVTDLSPESTLTSMVDDLSVEELNFVMRNLSLHPLIYNLLEPKNPQEQILHDLKVYFMWK